MLFADKDYDEQHNGAYDSYQDDVDWIAYTFNRKSQYNVYESAIKINR